MNEGERNFKNPAEVLDPAERTRLTREALVAAGNILKERYGGDIEGHCDVGAEITQRLLAQAGVRTVLVDGMYRDQATPKAPAKSYSHWWLYESITATIPFSLEEALQILKIVDATRSQFDDRPTLVDLGDDRYKPTNISAEPFSDFQEDNEWLWSPQELEQWKSLLKLLTRQE